MYFMSVAWSYSYTGRSAWTVVDSHLSKSAKIFRSIEVSWKRMVVSHCDFGDPLKEIYIKKSMMNWRGCLIPLQAEYFTLWIEKH